MLEVGVNAATDVTGFGLAGHGFEMASGSGVTLVIQLEALPLLPGAEEFARRPYLTRASATNAAYVASHLHKEGKPDPVRMEFLFDAQTSGGLLISVPADRAEALVTAARSRGAEFTCIVGDVIDRQDKALIVR